MRLIWGFVLFVSFLYGVEVDSKVSFQEILSSSSYYIDYNRTADINNIEKKSFKPIKTNKLGFGYSPNFIVWIKFTLTNKSDNELVKIIEYASPLTSFIDFYDAKSKKLLKSSGMLNKNSKESLNPVLKVKLKQHESRAFYIKISSNVTTLIAKLYAWDIKKYSDKLKENQVILALFFGAMGIIILYNSVIYLMLRKKMYLYYVVAFFGILVYYFLYQGLAPLFLSKESIRVITYLIPFIVLLPVVFLSLFTKEILELHKDAKLNKIFNIMLVVTVVSTFVLYSLNLHSIRNFSFVLLFFMLFGITLLSLKSNSYAKYLLISWFVFSLTALLMYLENIFVLNMDTIFPYYSEVALLFESLSFSLILAHSIERLELVKMKGEKELEYKELIINELDHRISGSLQSFLFRVEQEEEDTGVDLESLKQNIFAIGEINRHLNTTQNFTEVNMQEYLSAIAQSLQRIYYRPDINIMLNIESDIILKPKNAKSCGKILAEAITNIYKYAFDDKRGEIAISLKKSDTYIFIIADNGKGIQAKREGSLGIDLIEEFVKIELKGVMQIDSSNGTKITIRWQENE